MLLMVTIYDIAKATGYSAPTISKAITGNGTLKESTRRKILKSAEEMGYEPNLTARTLSTKKSNLIGVVFDDTGMGRGFNHPVFSVVLNKFREEVEKAGYDIIFLSKHYKMSYFLHARYRCVDGVIIINPSINETSDFEEFVKNGVACVSTNSRIPGMCTIISENEKGGYEAGKYFLKKGHKKFAYLSGPINKISYASQERFDGFARALNESNIEFNQKYFQQCDFWHIQAGYEGFKKLYERASDFTAIFVASDLLAYGVMNYAKEIGLRIPEDLSIIGFDDDMPSENCEPPLTTFRQNGNLIANKASQLLLQQLNGEKVPNIVRFDVELVERESVKEL